MLLWITIHDELLLLCLLISVNEYCFTLDSLDSVMFAWFLYEVWKSEKKIIKKLKFVGNGMVTYGVQNFAVHVF